MQTGHIMLKKVKENILIFISVDGKGSNGYTPWKYFKCLVKTLLIWILFILL